MIDITYRYLFPALFAFLIIVFIVDFVRSGDGSQQSSDAEELLEPEVKNSARRSYRLEFGLVLLALAVIVSLETCTG